VIIALSLALVEAPITLQHSPIVGSAFVIRGAMLQHRLVIKVEYHGFNVASSVDENAAYQPAVTPLLSHLPV
jgi:hypothetical protein